MTLLSAVAAIAPGVAAQDEATAMAEHALVGAWIIEPIADEPPELMIIIPGGIVTEAGPGDGLRVLDPDRRADA